MGSITSRLSNTSNVSTKITYPCLMKSKKSDLVVLFRKKECGMVVHAGGLCDVGEEANNWDMSTFQPYVGTIALESKP